MNTYGYVEANPLIFYDPFGLNKRAGPKTHSSRVQSWRDRRSKLERKQKETQDILDKISDVLDRIGQTARDEMYPMKCGEYRCPWDDIPNSSGSCPKKDAKIELVRSEANGCICIKSVPNW